MASSPDQGGLLAHEHRKIPILKKPEGAPKRFPGMTNSNQPKPKRGRPPSGKEARCIRMPPDTHVTLLKMAKYQETDLSGLLSYLASDWKCKMEFARSGGSSVGQLDFSFLDAFYDAKKAMEHLRVRIELDPQVATRKATKSAWQELLQLLENLAKSISKTRA
jgi:hypothetical protein